MSAITWNLISDYEQTNNAVFLIDLPSQTFCYVNDHACAKLGYSREELLQMRMRDIDPLIDEASLQKIAEQIIKQGFCLFETYHFTKDGRLFPVELNGNVFEYNGENFGLFVARDMTEHNCKEAEKQHLIDILEESPDFIGSADMEGKLLYHNHAAKKMMGLPDNADLSTMSIVDTSPGWVFQLICETVVPTILVHGVWRGESAVLHRDGHEIPVFQTVVLHRDTDGKPLFMSIIMHDLSDRKQKEAQLALLDYAFNYMDEAVYLIDAQARFVLINEKACRDLGYTRDELLQLKIFDIDPDYTPEHWQRRQDEIANGILSATLETRHRAKDGRVFPIEVRASHIPYQGQFYDIAMVRDISERKQKEEQLALLDYSFNYVDEGIFLINSEAQFVQVNEKACQSLGYSRDELLRMSIFDIDPDFTCEGWQNLLAEHEKGRKSITVETHHRSKDGMFFPVEVRGHYIAYQGQKYSFAMVRDITERKAAEKQLTVLNYALDHIKEEVWLIDEHARFHYVNQAACRSINRTYQEMLQLSVPDIKPDYGLEQWKEDWQRVKTAGSCTFETRHQSKEGDIFPVEVKASYFELDGQGYSLTFSHDISEQQRVEETLKFVAQRGWIDHNESFLVALTQYLAQLFQVDYVIIDKIGASSMQAETVALCVKGAIVPNMQYELQGTPCADVMNGKLCCYPERIQQLFPDDALLVEMQVESYAGLPLWDTAGNVLGLIAVLDSKPLHNPDFISSILQLVATSVAAELERQQAEQILRQSEHQFRVLAESLPSPVFRFDKECRRIYINPTAEKIAGIAAADLLYRKASDASPLNAEVMKKVEQTIEQVLKTGEPQEEEVLFKVPVSEQIYYFHNNYAPEFDANGEVVSVIMIAHDITERKRMENQLAAREHEFRTLAENVPDNLLRYDLQCRLHYMNPATILTLAPEAVPTMGKTPSQSFPNNQVAIDIQNAIKHAIETGEAYDMEVPWLNANGGIGTHHLRCVAERDSQGNITGALMLGRDITERKKMADELAVREREFRILVETSPSPIIRYDANCRRVYVNPAVEKMSGKTAAQMLNQAPSAGTLLHDQVKNEVEQVLKSVLKTGQMTENEVELVLADGQIHYFYNRYAPELDANGQAVGVVLIGHDITARKQAEKLTHQREQEFRTLAENMPANLSRYDLAGRLIYMNPALVTSLAPEVLPIIGKTLPECFPDDDVAQAGHETILRVIATGVEAKFEVVLPNPDHELRTHKVRHVAERDQNGKIMGVIAIGRDITERKRMRDELAAREREFRILVETSPAPIFRYDTQCRRIYVNPAVEKMTGKTAAQLLNRVPSDASVLSKSEGEKLESVLRKVIQTRQVAEGEIECVVANGETHHYYNRYAPELDTDGNVISVILVAHDITERKQTEQLLYQREQEFHTLVDNLPTTVLRYDRHLQRIYANPAYLQMIGCSETELQAKSIDDVWRATNFSVEAYKAILHNVMRDGEKQEILLEWTDRNGEPICHALKIVPEYAMSGQIQSVLVLGFDFSERHRQQIVEANRQQVFEKMARNNSLDAILEQVALYVESAKAGRYCAILLFDEAQNHLQLAAAPSLPESYCAKSRPLPLDTKNRPCHGLLISALSKQRVIIENIREHSCYSLCLTAIQEIGAVACWSEAIMSSTNQLLGVVTLYLKQAGKPDEYDLAHLLKAGHLSAIAIERKHIEQQMQHQASYDTLTGLPNRRLFHNRLQEEISKAERKGHQLAVLFIDLDHFKDVNDTLGHQIGDNLLVHAARRIQNCVRQSDTVARLGGDEFVVILPELDTVPPVERIAEAIIRAMTQPFKLGEYHTYVSASVGIAMYPQDAHQAETLVSYADQAMYSAKEAGRNSFNFFTLSMQEQAQQRLYLMNSLRDALEKNQLEVHYQPIIEVASGKAVKAEALLRWHHPVLGMVSPAIFIPLAEETDLIQSIGSWVFCQAADMAKRWNMLNDEKTPRKVSINMSPRQLIKGSGDQIAIDYLQAIALDSTYIVVEITEGLLLDDSPQITEKLERLRNGGIQLSLDDFGTGYSAMAYLRKFDINYLKIDRSFVRELETNADDRAITEAIVVMAHRLGLKVVAEGVETAGQYELLTAIGCEYIQGYFYAKPMPIEPFLSYVL